MKSRLSRQLNTSDAVVIGLGAMIGAGIFVAAAPAAEAIGSGLLLAVFVAGIIAYLNATSMAQLASKYPESGGTYVYGSKQLGPVWGFIAGWGFVIGKIASCSAMAMTFAYYAVPSEYTKATAIFAILALTVLNSFGIKKTARLTKIILVLVLLALATTLFASLMGGGADWSRLSHIQEDFNIQGLLEASGIMFFAFAGYARLATLGEEVRDPQNTIPKAIMTALFITVIIYLLVMTSLIVTVDRIDLASAQAPLALAVQSGKYAFLSPIVRIGAILASLGVLLSLLVGVSRTGYAMATKGDLPKYLSAVHPIYKTPYRAEIAVGLVVAAIVSIADLRTSIGFSSFAILIYYSIANAAAWTLTKEHRLWPKWMSLLGLVFCLVVAVSLPQASVIGGVILFALGLIYYFIKSGPKKD